MLWRKEMSLLTAKEFSPSKSDKKGARREMQVQSFLTIAILMILVSPGTSCDHREAAFQKKAASSYIPQIRSLSISGPRQAAVIVETPGNTRKFMLTTNGGDTWLTLNSPATNALFSSGTMIDGNR